MTLKERTGKLKRDVPAVFLALKDKETPVLAKVLAGVTVANALSPIDLIPDFIPVLGYLDDVILLPTMIALTVWLIPKDVWARCRAQSEKLWADGKPKKWYYAIPIVIFWLLVIWLIVRVMQDVRMEAEFVFMEKLWKTDNFRFAERTSGCRMRIVEGGTKQPCKSRTFS